MRSKSYSKQETSTIYHLYRKGYLLEQISEALKEKGYNRTVSSIKTHITNKKIRRGAGKANYKYTPDILEFIRSHKNKLSSEALAKECERLHPNPDAVFTAKGVQQKLSAMGLKRRSNPSQFKKELNAPGRSQETRFKKGYSPHNTRKTGDVYLRRQKGNSGSCKIYWIKHTKGEPVQPLHVYNWMQLHGNIPKGHVVTFKDGNPLNITVGDCSNLECISRTELLKRNRNYKKASRTRKINSAKKRTGESSILDAYLKGAIFS